MRATVTAVLEFESPDAYTTCDVKDGVYFYFRMLNPYIDNVYIKLIDVKVNELVEKSKTDLKSSSKEKRTSKKERYIKMKLNDVYSKSLKEVLEKDCEVVDQKIHTDEDGEIQAIEVKYKPKKSSDVKEEATLTGWGGR